MWRDTFDPGQDNRFTIIYTLFIIASLQIFELFYSKRIKHNSQSPPLRNPDSCVWAVYAWKSRMNKYEESLAFSKGIIYF